MNRIILTIIIFILHVCDVSYGARLSFNKERNMKKQTPTPTLMPFSFDQCEGSEDDVDRFRPRAHRKGGEGVKKRFRFNHVQSNAQCVNDKNLVYEGGEFEDCREFSVCAELCVKQVDENLARGGHFRGIEWYCPERTCYCLYDKGTLNDNNSGGFRSTRTGGRTARGSIGETRKSLGYHCAKLVGA